MLARDALWQSPGLQGAGAQSVSTDELASHATQISGGRVTVRFGISMRQSALVLAVLALALGGCGTLSGGLKSESLLAATATSVDSAEPVSAALAPDQTASGSLLAEARSSESAAPSEGVLEEYDPWEPFNEKMFSFNYKLDRYVLKPVAKGYNVVVPDRLQQMIDSGFDNLLVVQRVVNNLLQWRLKGASAEMGRFLINSTLGIGGLFDIAKQEFGLQKTRVDFGQTLGIWGMSPGPFLVLPLLPPLTVRDGIGTAVDGAMDPLSYVLPFIWTRLGMRIGNTINDRSLNLDLYQGFEETTVDLYSAVRNGYLQRRDNLIKAPAPY